MMKNEIKNRFFNSVNCNIIFNCLFYSRSKSATLTDPILINFEKQKVASFSDF